MFLGFLFFSILVYRQLHPLHVGTSNEAVALVTDPDSIPVHYAIPPLSIAVSPPLLV